MLALFSVVRTVTATVERAAGFISIHATHVGSDNCYTPRGGSRLAFAFAAFILLRCLCTQTSSLAYTAVSRLAAPRLYGDARTSACLMGRDLLFPNRSSRGSTRPHNFLAFRDTAHTGNCDAIPTIEDFAMSRVLTATMLPTAHHEEVVF